MLFTTPTEWAALGVTLFAGWLFGLASSSGGKKWKRQLEEHEVEAATRIDEAEAELRAARERIRELERQGTAASGTVPIAAAAGAGAVAATAMTQDAAPSAEPVGDDAAKTWIPEGPPPPPLAMGAPEPAPAPAPQPIVGDASVDTPAAVVQAEAETVAPSPAFPSTAPAQAAPEAEVVTIEAAPTASDPAEPAGAEAQPVAGSPEWLPPHVRAEETQP